MDFLFCDIQIYKIIFKIDSIKFKLFVKFLK